ncbi:hypothetical protein JW905_02950 [bacterium]|nr:hypothetical protein [candidate division CSSED10-310 bacterium]
MCALMGNQSGKADSKTPVIIALVLAALLIFLATKFVPPYMAQLDFKEKVIKIVNWDRFFNGATPPTVDSVVEQIRQTAQQMKIPLDEKNLVVTELDDKRIQVKLHYIREVKLPLYGVYKWRFEIFKVQDL